MISEQKFLFYTKISSNSSIIESLLLAFFREWLLEKNWPWSWNSEIFYHIPALVLDESNWLNVLSPVQTNISAVWTFFPARRPRQWTKKNMLYHIRDGTYEIKDLSSALLCRVVSKMNEGTRGSNIRGQIIVIYASKANHFHLKILARKFKNVKWKRWVRISSVILARKFKI